MSKDYFKGRTIVLATKHEKEKVISKILEKELGVKVVVPTDFDTDQFGTFSGEIKRSGDQLEAARYKALAGMKHCNADLGVSSEGSFGMHPSHPFILSNLELVVLIDKENNIEIRGHHRSQETNACNGYAATIKEAKEFAMKCGFPEHGIILKNKEHGKKIYKGIKTFEELEKCFYKLSGLFSKKVFIETDLRAHMNPTRMKNIKLATEDLVRNAKNTCIKCGCPGFAVIDVEKGLPCNHCNVPSDLVIHYIYGCQKCDYKQTLPRSDGLKTADPGLCDYCNP